MEPEALRVVEKLTSLESRFRNVFVHILNDSEFIRKYKLHCDAATEGALVYVFTTQPTPLTFEIEAFAGLGSHQTAAARRTKEVTYHGMFEDVIDRYTKTRKKPNPVLMETRSSDFCHTLTVRIEAVPPANAKRPISFLLLREFQILHHMWEQYRLETADSKFSTDQLVGFPMPFEFRSVNAEGTEYDLRRTQSMQFNYYGPNGKLQPLQQVTIPSSSLVDMSTVKSTLSYMSLEKLGPSLDYLMELMLSQGKCFTVSSALKVYDQLLCRLLIMHRSAVVHGDINPTALSFGTGEAFSVVYIGKFESAIVTPTTAQSLPYFHDRFVASGRLRDKFCHFVHDLEAAFYVFIYLLLGRMPWDSRQGGDDPPETATDSTVGAPHSYDKGCTLEDKEKFWGQANQFRWLVKSIKADFQDTTYRNFTAEVIESIYAKVNDSISNCRNIGQTLYVRDISTPGTDVYNAYFGVRKIIASYFRFESCNAALKDPVWSAKTDTLVRQDAEDRRVAWDLSSWCWNCIDMSATTRWKGAGGAGGRPAGGQIHSTFSSSQF